MKKQYSEQQIDYMLKTLGQVDTPGEFRPEFCVDAAAAQQKQDSGNKKRFSRRYAIPIAACLAVLCVISAFYLFGNAEEGSRPDSPGLSDGLVATGVYGQWEYAEYDTYVILTNLRLNKNQGVSGADAAILSNAGAAGHSDGMASSITRSLYITVSEPDVLMNDEEDTESIDENDDVGLGEEVIDDSSVITIPDEIESKPVVDMEEDCVRAFIELYGSDWEGISLNVSEYNEYFTMEETFNEIGAGYFHSLALYNKDKTTLYFVYFDSAEAPAGWDRFVIPGTVTKIYHGALCHINNPVEFDYNEEYFAIEQNLLFDKEQTRLIRVMDIYADIFNYNVPDSVMSLDPGAFKGVTGNQMDPAFFEDKILQATGMGLMDITVSLPDSIAAIPDYAFAGGYAGLKKTPDNLEYIGSNALVSNGYYGKLNKTFFIPAGVSEIGERAFSSDSVILEIDEKNQYYTIDDNALYNKDKTELILFFGANYLFDPYRWEVPDTVTLIHSGAICAWDGLALRELYVPASVTEIDDEGIELYYWDEPITVIGEKGSRIESYIAENLAFNAWRNWYPLINFQPIANV